MEEDLMALITANEEGPNRPYLHYDYIKKLNKYFCSLDTVDFFMALLLKEYYPGSACNFLRKTDINELYDAVYKFYVKDLEGTLINPAYLEGIKEVLTNIDKRRKKRESK